MVQGQGSRVRHSGLKIGEVAAGAGVSVDTVRLYERRGLLLPPDRTASGYRMYPRSAVDRIVLTRQLRQLGMTLDEIAAAFNAAQHGTDCSSELWRLQLVRERLDAKIAELTATRGQLVRFIDSCEGCGCRIQIGPDGVSLDGRVPASRPSRASADGEWRDGPGALNEYTGTPGDVPVMDHQIPAPRLKPVLR